MPMPQRVQYSDAIEPLVQFIEDTPPSEILDRTLDKLRAGVPTETMLTASALAVTRSTEMPPGHHGGPLHPLAGLYAISKTVERLEGEQRFVPVLQHVALTNKHINHPAMGPYALFEFAPEDAGGVEATKAAFLTAVGRGEWNKADHLYQWLWNNAPRIEAFDLLLGVAIPKNFNDDHYFMFPGTVWRAFETGVLDDEFFTTVMRPVVRFVTRSPVAPNNPMPSPLPQIEALIEEHQLLKRIYRQRSGEDERPGRDHGPATGNVRPQSLGRGSGTASRPYFPPPGAAPAAGVQPGLHGHLGHPRQLVQAHHVAEDRDLGMPGDGQVLLDHDAPGPVLVRTGGRGQRRGHRWRLHPGRPQHGVGVVTGLLAGMIADEHPALVDMGDDRAHVLLDPQLVQAAGRLLRQLRAEHGQRGAAAVEEAGPARPPGRGSGTRGAA